MVTVTAAVQQETRVLESSVLLIVEDDSALRAQFRDLLQAHYRLIFVESGADAPAILRQQPADLVLLDMAALASFDLLRAIRSSDLPPIILISTLDDSSRVVQGLRLGAADYITKPLDADVLRARVSTQLSLKRSDDERKQTITQLKFTQEMQENFTRIVSHDLKGPLTNIRMAQFMLRDILRDNVEARSILDNMEVTLTGMIEMIRVFLDAMDSQQLTPVIEPLDVHDLIVQVVEQYRYAAAHKQISLTMHDADRRALADERLLRQVLGNLVSNAVKFSPKGTEATVWTESRGDRMRICVADGGPGIPQAEQGKLFTMFSKLSTRPTGDESSTGLGLWIVRELTRLQHGEVGCDQPPEGGSLFWIELPGA